MYSELANYIHNRQLPPQRFIKDTIGTVPLSHTDYKGEKFNKEGAKAVVGKLKENGKWKIQSILVPKKKYIKRIMKSGGLIETTTINQLINKIAKKHNVTTEQVREALAIGAKHELEHKNTIEFVKKHPHVSVDTASKLIALDHFIDEGLKYYPELELAEERMDEGGIASQRFSYIAVSRTKSQRFNEYSYILSKQDEDRLSKLTVLTYGYLRNSNKIGSTRGWYVMEKTIAPEDFEKYYTYVGGIKKAKARTMDKGGKVIVTKDGKAGGLLVGKTDKDGGEGIPAVIEETKEPIIVGGGEVIINEDAVNDKKKRSFDNMTNKEILNAINTSTGGRPIMKDGGMIPVTGCGCTEPTKKEEGGTATEQQNDFKEGEIIMYSGFFHIIKKIEDSHLFIQKREPSALIGIRPAFWIDKSNAIKSSGDITMDNGGVVEEDPTRPELKKYYFFKNDDHTCLHNNFVMLLNEKEEGEDLVLVEINKPQNEKFVHASPNRRMFKKLSEIEWYYQDLASDEAHDYIVVTKVKYNNKIINVIFVKKPLIKTDLWILKQSF